MAKPIIVANWKNHPNSFIEAKDLLKDLARKKALFAKTSFFIAPPAPYLELVSKSFAKAASQDVFPIEKGSHTGEVSIEMLKSFGVKLSIIGHSERRAQGETSAMASEKVKAALKAGITPLLCVGELSRDAEGEYFSFIQEELKSSLAGVSKKDAEKVLIAYEPVWAIGKSAKDAIDTTDLCETLLFLRKSLTDLFGRETAEKMTLLYGGSVEPRNAKALIGSGVKGFLVGHASLDAKSLAGIIEAIFEK